MKRDDSDVTESNLKQRVSDKKARANLMQILRSEVDQVVATGELSEQHAEGLVHDVALMLVGKDLNLPRRTGNRRVRRLTPSVRGVVRKLIRQKLAEKSPYHIAPSQRGVLIPAPASRGMRLSYRVFDKRGVQPLLTSVYEGEQVVVSVVFDTPEKLTPSFLGSDVVPYLNALVSIQSVLDELRSHEPQPSVIHSVKYWNPLGVDVTGLDDVLKTLRDWIVPWRRKNAKRLAEIEAQRAQAELKKAEAEALKVRTECETERAEAKKMRAEAKKLRAEAKRTMVESESLQLEVQRDKIQLGLNIISSLNSDLTESEKMTYALRIKDGLDTLIHSRLELKKIDGKNF